MERGLLWLPLLLVFFGLAWSGWSEYRKLQAYSLWAEAFDQAKYDIYAVLGQKGKILTWGKPTRQGPINLESFSLEDVQDIRLLVDGRNCLIELDSLPQKGVPVLEFNFLDHRHSITIPFTEISLAAKWARYLEKVKNQD